MTAPATADCAGSNAPLTRRRVLAASTGLAAAGVTVAAGGAPALAQGLAAAGEGGAGAAMLTRARSLADSLEPAQRARFGFAFDGRTRRAWNFMGARAKPGLRLEEMRQAQKDEALALLATALSPAGMDKAERVMILQDVLREAGSGASDRNRERFSFAVFGTPSPVEPWGWRVEGHHLSLSFTLVGTEVVSVTPSSFSSNPNVVSRGRHAGLVALEREQTLARRLFADVSPVHRDRALIRERAYRNILATAGREDRFSDTREGVPLADLHSAQQDLALELIEAYAVDHLTSELESNQRVRLKAGDLPGVHFAWAGANREGEEMYYRLHGDNVLIEFASLPNQPLHLHTVRHDLQHNLGAHRV